MTCHSLLKRKYFHSSKILESAKGQPCTIRLPGICNNDKTTTVACHLNYGWAGKGLGIKAEDIVCFCCSDCHRVMDGQDEKAWLTIYEDKHYFWLRGLFETTRFILLAIKDGKLKL